MRAGNESRVVGNMTKWETKRASKRFGALLDSLNEKRIAPLALESLYIYIYIFFPLNNVER